MAVIRVRSLALNTWLIPGSALLAFSLLLATCRGDATAPSLATRLAFTVQPTTTIAGHRITPAVQVAALDASGKVVPGFRGAVTVTLTAGTGTSATEASTAGTGTSESKLTGTVVAAAVDGVVDFATLSIDKSGTGYTLTALAPGLTAATSAAFDIIPGPATRLGFTGQPANTTAGATMTPVEVTVQDSLGNTVPGFTDSVTVSIAAGTGPAGAALSGSGTVAAVAGVATFSTLSLDQSATAYTLLAKATGLAGATSAPFAIPAGGATQLVFTAQPKTATGGATIAPAVQVVAQDPLGNLVPGFAGSVTVTITVGTGPGGAKLSGTATVAAVGGIATFSTLSIDKTGTVKSRTAYTLSAAAAGL